MRAPAGKCRFANANLPVLTGLTHSPMRNRLSNRVCERVCERLSNRLCKRLSELTPFTMPTGQDSKNNLSMELEVKRTTSNRIPSTDTYKGILLAKTLTNLFGETYIRSLIPFSGYLIYPQNLLTPNEFKLNREQKQTFACIMPGNLLLLQFLYRV